MRNMSLVIAPFALISSTALADVIIPIEQSRIVAALTSAECEGTVESGGGPCRHSQSHEPLLLRGPGGVSRGIAGLPRPGTKPRGYVEGAGVDVGSARHR